MDNQKRKSRVAVRLKERVGGKKSHNKSEDLARLQAKYDVFCKRLQGLLTALRAQHQAMLQIAKSRFQVAQHLAVLSKDTCLFEQTGQMPGADRSTDSVNSYLSVHEGAANKYKIYANKYGQFVVNYTEEWYKVVTTRVGNGLKKAEEMRVEVDHYQQKVESLRQSANQTMAKGKQVDNKSAEKLKRNEDKLLKIKEANTRFTADLCLLAEEVTERAWRDLHPLLVKTAQFDVTLSADEAKAMASLNSVVSQLKKIADQHGIKPQARLKDMETLDPKLLSTAQGGSSTLQIESGLGGLSMSSSTGGDMHHPPGTVAPQGLGGFPVQISSGGASVDASARSNHSSVFGGSVPSTMDMMNVNSHAAPPPTMDTLSQAFGPGASSSGPPSSGGIPPLGRARNPSMDSFDSFRSGGSAPPPAAPPPPPPGQAPMSGGYNPFGSGPAPAPAPNSYGAPPPGPVPVTSTNPFGHPPPPAPSSYGSGPPQQAYGQYSGSAPPSYNYPPQNNFAQQPHMQPHMQAPPAPSSYGAPPQMQAPQYPPQSQQPQQQKYLGYNPF
mmetsp:Transcript_54629/g.132662  ORF Transcript_54629/g.132662 Transcript_54629/m.132662 type:complete len:553 (+) Transcript_54629:149-1807(+)